MWHARTSSTWLSSFVLRTMCCAREHIEVDPNIVSGLIDFLGTRQNANGQVVEPENVIHREMVVCTTLVMVLLVITGVCGQGGVQESGVSMTAYTVMSLLECCSVDEKPILVVCSILSGRKRHLYPLYFCCFRKRFAQLFNTCRIKLQLA